MFNNTSLDSSRDHRQRGGMRKSAARCGGAPASRLSMIKRTEVQQQVHFDLRDFFGYFLHECLFYISVCKRASPFLLKESDKKEKKMKIDG